MEKDKIVKLLVAYFYEVDAKEDEFGTLDTFHNKIFATKIAGKYADEIINLLTP